MIKDFLKCSYKKVKWVSIIDSWKDWPTLWIFAVNHGNEPVWLHVFEYLINEIKIEEKLLHWKILLITVNLKAYQKFCKQKNQSKYRFIDHNMNRIHNKVFQEDSYEFKRKKELEKILDELDYGIDLHSVSKWNNVIWITDNKYINNAHKFLDVETILVDDIPSSWAFIWYMIERQKEAYWLECWNHTDNQAYLNWIKNVINLMIDKWFINWKIEKKASFWWTYKFINEIFPKTNKFKFVKDYMSFDKILKDEIYATDWEIKFNNTFWKDIYIGLVWKYPKAGDGIGFLFDKLV